MGAGSSIRLMVWNLGKAGVGADGDAICESINSTSLASMLSVLSSAVKMIGVGLVMSEEREEDGVGPRDDFLRTETFAKGESWGILVRRGLGAGPESVLRRTDPLERCAMRLTAVGVEGAEPGARDEPDEDADDGGRVIVAAAGLAVLLCLGRVGDGTRAVGEDVLDVFVLDVFLSGVEGGEGVTLIADVRLTCSALRCGRGLIARVVLSADLARSSSLDLPFSSFSSSDVLLRRRRVPARAGGDGPCFSVADSMSWDFGLYLGNAEPGPRVLRGRRDDARFTPILGLIVLVADCSSEDVPPLGLGNPDNLRAFLDMVFASGEAALSFLAAAALSVDEGAGGTRLLRFETAESFTFFPFSFSPLGSLLSLCMASARAFPIEEKLRDFSEARVMGRVRCGSPVASAGIVDVVVRVYRSDCGSERR